VKAKGEGTTARAEALGGRESAASPVASEPSGRLARLELLPVARRSRTNHRPSLSPLVGRVDVLDRIASEVAAGRRLFTVVGPPGIGKTRVASALLDRLGPDYAKRGGAYFCDLSEAKTESELAFAVSSVLGERGEGGAGLHVSAGALSTLVEDLLVASGPTLLVLDNFEQLVFAAGLIERWCRAAFEAVIVVTSRERLSIEGELLIELLPLDVSSADPEQGEAVSLFVSRVREVGGTLGDDPRAALEIVRRLEGIPLAIELAASRTRVLSAKDLAKRLARGHDVLDGARGRVEGRHATLGAALEGSWSLLDAEERDALARIAVFAGGFTLEAAEAVLVGPTSAVDVIGALRDKSLVHVTREGRLALYVSIRELGEKKLAALGEASVQDARMRHARFFAEASRTFAASRALADEKGAVALYASMHAERENLSAALAYVKAAPRTRETARLQGELAGALALVLALPGERCIEELTSALEAELEARGASVDREATEPIDPSPVAQLLFARQGVHNSLGDYAACNADLARVRAMPGIPPGLVALAGVYQGIQSRYQGHAREAWGHHVEAEALLARLGAGRLATMNQACMGRLACDLGDEPAARAHNERAFAASEAQGQLLDGALALANLAQLEQELGAFDRARTLLERAVSRLSALEESHYEAIYASVCGDLFFETGELTTARRWYETAARFLSRFPAHRPTGILHASFASLLAASGDLEAAEGELEAARACASRISNPVVALSVELATASVALLRVAASDERDERDVRARALTTRLHELRAPRSEGRAPTSDAETYATSFDVRFAARTAERIVRQVTELPARASSLAHSEAKKAVLRLTRDARTVVLPEGEAVSLERRGSLRRLVLALVQRRLGEGDGLAADRGRGLSVDELAEAGWPGERVLVEAAQTRVRVAVATLRKLGLRGLLVTRDDGYVLDPAVEVEWISHEA
jgi:predicted ATPase/predicted negative regulator of RcsB-dependent stress response